MALPWRKDFLRRKAGKHHRREGGSFRGGTRNGARSSFVFTVLISTATERNWKRLRTSPTGRLTARANKRLSVRRFVPVEYLSSRSSAAQLKELADFILAQGYDTASCLFTLAVEMLSARGLLHLPHVQDVLAVYVPTYRFISTLTDRLQRLADEIDPLGALYQSLLSEGDKNRMGSYFTPPHVAREMVQHLDFSAGQLFYDPCCGSGVFLTSLRGVRPEQIYGSDSDPCAVFIAKINMLLRFASHVFIPQIECAVYGCSHDLFGNSSVFKDLPVDYIYTNPPWGAQSADTDDSFAPFVTHAFRQIKSGGLVDMLLPEAVLNVKAHSSLRRFLLNYTHLRHIRRHDFRFSGVQSGVVDVAFSKAPPASTVLFCRNSASERVPISAFHATEQCVFSPLTQDELDVLHFLRASCPLSLRDSSWALGIVTGNNKEKLFSSPAPGTEPIFTGKDVHPFRLSSPSHFIYFKRTELQQVAPDSFYRAPEKLLYRFISDRPIFAYDSSRSLVLNSANILIPNVPGMSVLTVLAFLNSDVIRFVYHKLFGECVKVLKSNLAQLPLPSISRHQDAAIAALTRHLLEGEHSAHHHLADLIFTSYGLSDAQIAIVKNYSYEYP